MGVLRRRTKPIGESRRSRLVPSSLDDASNPLVLQGRRGRDLLLRKQRLMTMLLILIYTSVGGRLRDRAIRLTMIDRLIEQDKVLLMGRQIQVL